mgnify:CR=1 FL=1
MELCLLTAVVLQLARARSLSRAFALLRSSCAPSSCAKVTAKVSAGCRSTCKRQHVTRDHKACDKVLDSCCFGSTPRMPPDVPGNETHKQENLFKRRKIDEVSRQRYREKKGTTRKTGVAMERRFRNTSSPFPSFQYNLLRSVCLTIETFSAKIFFLAVDEMKWRCFKKGRAMALLFRPLL